MDLSEKERVMINWLSRFKSILARRIVLMRTRNGQELDFAFEARRFYDLLVKYNASVSSDNDMCKMQYTLLRENHIIEKGMSMKYPRKGFGQLKVQALLARLNKYYSKYGEMNRAFINYPLDTINQYIDYTKKNGVEITSIEEEFGSLCKKVGYCPAPNKAGVMIVRDKEIQAASSGNFESLLRSRHSIRYFDQDHLPTHDQIDAALTLAQRTPSACNRQAWHTHVYQGAQSVDLIKWQSGSRGFEDEITSSILVTADLKGFLDHEVHQAYVDGGLYAMNLINAIHSLGMGSIPLSTGFKWRQLAKLSQFGIPENEVPILIIGFGNLLPEFKVAVSTRKEISQTNVYH